MDFSWISLFLLSFAWTAAIHIYEPPTPFFFLLIAVAAVFSFLGFIRREKTGIVPSIKSASMYCALILLLQGAVFPFYYIWAARRHSEGLFASLTGGILNFFDVRTVCEGSLLYIYTSLKTIVFSSSWEKIGAVWIILLMVGGVVTLMLKRARVRHYVFFFTTTFFYAVLRYVFLIMLYLTYSMHSAFWERIITFFTFIPFPLILMVLFKHLPLTIAEIGFSGVDKRKAIITGALAFLLVFSGVSFFSFHDLGNRKQGRVLVDEYHSDWEWTTDIYDEQWFGERSGYNYYCFFNYLDKFYETERNMSALNGDTLKDVDVFIMKTPTKPFSTEEVELIVSFVRGGGGLYLIGDHTNVFGTGTNLNQISKTFGLTFNYDCTYELTNGNLSEYDAPKIMPHPAVSDLPHFLFATSNTLDAKWQAEEIMIGYGLKGLQADYSQKNFFPADTNAPAVEFGLFLQSAGVQYGRGRVLAFTDSTVFSNFWMFMPGKPELLLKSVEWLNRESFFTSMTPRDALAVVLAVALIINVIWGFKNRKNFPMIIFITAGLSALLIGSVLFHISGAAAVKLPESIKPITTVRFEREYSRFKLPDDLDGFLSNMDEQLNTFYVWTQRLDYFPSVEDKLSDALRNGDLAVMAKPDRKIKNPQEILEMVSTGGKLLILDNMASGAFSNSLLKSAGMELVDADMEQYADYAEIKNVPLSSSASSIIGGEAIIRDAAGNPVLSVQKIGGGVIAVFSDPDLFYNYELGDVSANLTDKTEILTNLEFRMLKTLLEQE